MLSQYVLLCAPYRFFNEFNFMLNKTIIEKELYNPVLTFTNCQTRPMLRHSLENNFGIVDKNTLLKELDDLQKGNYHYIKNVKDYIGNMQDATLKSALDKLYIMANGKDIQGFDDCRIIDTITKAYAVKIINKNEFNNLFEEHYKRIENDYTSWEQYLSSCILGKMAQHAIVSPTVTTEDEFINDIYGFCINDVNAFSYSTFWQNHNLDNLGLCIAEVLGYDYNKDKEDLRAKMQETKESTPIQNISPKLAYELRHITVDEKRFDYLSDLAHYVIWDPIVENELDWMFTLIKGEQYSLLMPKEFSSMESAVNFWVKYFNFEDLEEENIFAIFLGTLSVKALFTEKKVYSFEKKMLFKKVTNEINWEDVKLESKLDLDLGLTIKLNGTTIFDTLEAIDYTLIGLSKQEVNDMDSRDKKALEDKYSKQLNLVLADIPKRIKEFKSTNN